MVQGKISAPPLLIGEKRPILQKKLPQTKKTERQKTPGRNTTQSLSLVSSRSTS